MVVINLRYDGIVCAAVAAVNVTTQSSAIQNAVVLLLSLNRWFPVSLCALILIYFLYIFCLISMKLPHSNAPYLFCIFFVFA